MLFSTLTRACGARTWSGCTTAALLLIATLAAPAVWAHNNPSPPAASATGIGISLTAFRADGTTPVLTSGDGTVTQCESIFYRATLSWAGGDNAAFEGGTWTLTTPDGVIHDVTPGGGIPCVGGNSDDPISAANGNRGICVGSPASILSALVPYTVDVLDIVGGNVNAATNLVDAYAHINTADQFGVGAFTPFPLAAELCDDGLFCNGAEICDEQATDGVRTGLCGPGTPPVCDDGLFCNGTELCDEGTDSCTPGTAPVCDNGLFCDGLETCDEVTDACAPGTAPVCDNGLFCDGLETCDEVTDACVPGTAPVCDNGLFCDGLETCDEVTDACVPGTAPVCDNGMFCDGTETCDEITDACVPGTPPNCAAEGDECNEGLCDEEGDTCYTSPIPPDEAPDVCFGEEICRTPGFWGSRGGFAGDGYYSKGQNVTGSVLCGFGGTLVNGECTSGGLEVCGTLITNTFLGDGQSATEAICIKGGDPRAKLMRMLMSASLNCALGDCSANTSGLVSYCNTVCADETSAEYQWCHGNLGCFNEGGHITESGECVPAGQSVCEVSLASCSDDDDCNVLGGESCVSWESCHDRQACPDDFDGDPEDSDFCFEPLGAASSPQKCNAARQTTPYIFNLPGWGTN